MVLGVKCSAVPESIPTRSGGQHLRRCSGVFTSPSSSFVVAGLQTGVSSIARGAQEVGQSIRAGCGVDGTGDGDGTSLIYLKLVLPHSIWPRYPITSKRLNVPLRPRTFLPLAAIRK